MFKWHVKAAIKVVQTLQVNQQLPSERKSREATHSAAADNSAKRKPEHVGGGKPAKLAKRDKAIKDEKYQVV